MPVTMQPLTASVTITAGSSTYFNATTLAALPGGQFRLLRGVIMLSAANKASNVQLEIEDNNATWFSTFTVGSSVSINVGKVFAGGWTSVFTGKIERSMMNRLLMSVGIVTLYCSDLMQTLMDKIVIHYEKHQLRNPDGTVNVANATTMLVTDIIINLMNSTDNTVYFNGVKPTVAAASTGGGGFITPNTGVSIPDVNFIYKPLHDCLKELFDYIRYDWGVDASGNLYGRPIENAADSGITLDASTIMNIRIEDDVTQMKNLIFVIGGDKNRALVGTTTALSTNSNNNSSVFLAQKFTPTSDRLSLVQIMLDKVGAPANLACAVYTDNSNKPSNTAITYSNIDKTAVSSTSAAWTQFNVGQKVTAAQPYWIVLFSQKDNTNYYRWYTDGTAATSTATATDALASTAASGGWSTVAGTSAYGHNVYFVDPIQTISIDVKSTSTYGTRELADRQPEIIDQIQAMAWVQALKATVAKKKQLLVINTFPPDTILTPGKLVTVADATIVTTTYIMTDILYELQGYESYNMRVQAVRYVAA